MRPVTIAQIGSGHDHAPMTFHSLMSQEQFFHVAGFCEIGDTVTPEMYSAVPSYTVEELLRLDSLEAVAVECQEKYSTDIAIAFMEKGIAVHLDKPGSQDISSFRHLTKLSQTTGVPLHMGYMYRYNPSVMELIRLVKSGELGEIYSVEAQMNCIHSDEKRCSLKQFRGGMMYYLGCHLVDIALQIMGEPDKVLPLNRCTMMNGVEAEDFGMAVLLYPHGAAILKCCDTEENGYARRQLTVSGSRGTWEIKPWELPEPYDSSMITSPTRVAFSKDNPKHSWKNMAREINFGVFSRYDIMMQHFAGQVRGEKSQWTPKYEQLLYETLLKCCGFTEEELV